MVVQRTEDELRYLKFIKSIRRRIPQILEHEKLNSWAWLNYRYRRDLSSLFYQDNPGWRLIQPSLRVILSSIQNATLPEEFEAFHNMVSEYIELRKHAICMKLIRSLDSR